MPTLHALPPSLYPPRRWLHAAILAVSLLAMACQQAAAQTSDRIELDLGQARNLAIAALENGDPGTAILLSKELLKATPEDPLIYYILARAHARLGDPDLARRAAALSYRFADSGPARFEAAQLASQMAFQADRYSLSQLWLRRTAIHAPTERDEERVARDYRLLRKVNPWSLRIRTDMRPSNNVNNGTDTSLNIIDGVPDGGTIDSSALALSGLIASLDLAPSYRLRSDANSATSLGARLYIERVALSSEAKELAPHATGSDFGSTYGELSMTHAFAIGSAGQSGSAAVEFALGDSWYGGARSYQFARLEGRRGWALGSNGHLQLRANAEQRYRASYTANDARILGLGAEFGTELDNGGIIGLQMALRDANAASPNGSYSSASIRASYTLGRTLGPARLSMGLVVGYTRYDQFVASLFLPPTQRTDTSAYGDISLIFERYDYAGFVPILRLRTGQKNSNFSRFSSQEVSVSLGVGSKF
ncbi:tetratricopeptide repeat protein [Sedimentitalea nanhaiensis]|uniref:Tetratricopeptide repeat-containing protein n=1 Tax=Sedimentitalea nanhaiensis TaxID=999627 RepID=A0A1I6ZGI0_9RHOB|nr:hypothetical protein [Sedimentitalea nanhaiensis]SFT61759.1 Tetratricopeptide repeat-containing protein [Sedimentitalea nanhaiensis]